MRSVFAASTLRNLSASFAISLLTLAAAPVALHAQTAAAVTTSARVTVPVDTTQRVPLAGNVPAWANVQNDLGAVSPSLHLDNLHLILARSPAVEAAFQQLLIDQQDPASTRYHQWLTPQQNADQYGIAPTDLAAVTNWLTSQGLQIDNVAAGGLYITFSGSAASVQGAFATQLHNFTHDNATRFAPLTEPQVPAALGSVIRLVPGIAEEFAHTSLHQRALDTAYTAHTTASGVLQPDTTFSSGSHLVGPGDFNTIYDIPSTLTGAGLKAVNIISSRITASDITGFNAVFGINVAQPNQILLPGSTDPGVNSGSETEADLDVQRILGTAQGSTVDLLLVSSLSYSLIYSALQYEISTLNDPAVNMSFGSCAVSSGSTSSSFDSYAQTASAQGVSVFVSSGDNGAAGCDAQYSTIPSPQVLSTNAICASSYITCVGGTEFNDVNTQTTYWGTNNSQLTSALSYIPEGAWNEPTYTSNGATLYQAAGGGGGTTAFPKPTFQTGTGVPADGLRDVPDISFLASDYEGYILCEADFGNTCAAGSLSLKYVLGGTSASSPSMAGIALLLNQKTGTRQGNMNPLLYRLAASSPTAFHDVTVASSGVTNCTTATPSICNNSTPSATGLSGGLAGYAVNAGFDLATGLGSLDVAKFIAAASPVATTLAVTASPSPAVAGGSVTLTATLTPGTSTFTPSGTVQFYSNGVAIGTAATLTANKASINYTFATAGTYAITAIYTGDTNFAGSTAPAFSLIVSASPSFTVTPATATLAIVSGINANNTDNIAIASINSFAGTVALTCTVTNQVGNTAGTCSVAPTSATLTSGSASTTVLTVNSTAGTSGTFTATVTGTSGTTVVTSTAVTVTVTAPGFTLTANPTTAALISGATATSVISITSTNNFAGTVNLTCAAASNPISATATGTCSLSPATITLTAGATVTSTLTTITTPSTSGQLVVTVTGTQPSAGVAFPASGTTTETLTLTASSFTAAPTGNLTVVAGATTGNTDVISFGAINGFSGAATLVCTVTNTGGNAAGTCTVSPTTVSIPASGALVTSTATILTTPGTGGALTVTVKATGTATGGTIPTTATATFGVTVIAPSFTLAAPSLSFTSGATTGNTSTITVTSVNTFAGPLSLTCALSPSSAASQPVCSIAPSSVTLTSGGTATAVVSFSTITAHAKASPVVALHRTMETGGAMFALLLCLVPFRKRRSIRSLMAFLVLFGSLAALSGCSGGGTAPTTPQSSAGSYTVTITGTGTTTGATSSYTTTTTFSLTVN